ncbi:hypothetical protein J2S82_003413 [Aeromonas caviae]|nr:hypothetical protein [Aeromonas caviae]
MSIKPRTFYLALALYWALFLPAAAWAVYEILQ